jgi:predicted nucleic acid-binding protein
VSAALLDVNVLIALVDPRHVHHELAHRWFAGPGIVQDRLLDSAQLTDTYLLALATHNKGTLDRRLRGDGVRGGAEALLVLQEGED